MDHRYYIQRVEGFEQQIRDAKVYITQTNAAWVEAHCTIKPGDVLKVSNSVSGKHTGKAVRVQSVTVRFSHLGWCWRCCGHLLSKSGNPLPSAFIIWDVPIPELIGKI